MAFTDVLANAPRPQKIAVGIVGLVIVAALGYFMVLVTPAEKNRSAASRSRSSGLDFADAPDSAAKVSAAAGGKSRGSGIAGKSG